MADTDTQTVAIGGRDVALRPLSGRRAFHAMRIIARIHARVDDVQIRMRDFARRWAESTPPQRITRQMAWHPQVPEPIREMTAEQWDAVGGFVELPSVETPPATAIMLELLPVLLDAAENEVLELLALAACSNDEFGSAVIAGTQDQLLESKRLELLGDDVEFAQLIALADAIVGFTVDQLRSLEAKVGNLRRLLGLEAAIDPEPDVPQEESSTTPRPGSSTSSPPPTGGASSASSTEPHTDASSDTSA